jgi:hypothetical protein
MRGERMPIGNEEHTIILILHLHKTLHRPEIITEVQVARRAYSTNNTFHVMIYDFLALKGTIISNL